MNTLTLDKNTWDLVVDAKNNIGVSTDGIAIAQDVASAVKLFQGELWYNTSLGIPYFTQILGKGYSLPLVQQQIAEAALTVPGVVKSKAVISSFTNRLVAGAVFVIDTVGQTLNVTF